MGTLQGGIMLGLSRKTRGEMMRAELGQSWDHFIQAASHAANGVGKSVGPSTQRFFGTVSPLMVAYRDGAADAIAVQSRGKTRAQKKKGRDVSGRRVGVFIGLLAAGAAIGAAGALLMRRQQQQPWSEYDPDAFDSDTRSMAERAKSGNTMGKMSNSASKAMDKTAQRLQSAASSMRKSDNPSGMKSNMDESAERASQPTDTSSSKLNSRS